MNTLEERIKKIKNDYKLELAEIKAGEEIKKKINFSSISRHSYLSDYVVTMPKMDFIDALTEIEKLNPININLVKGTFTAFVPEFSLDFYTKKEEKHIKIIEAIGGYYYKVSQFGNKLSCFKEIAGYKIKIDFPVNDSLTRVSWEKKGNHHGETWVENVQLINKTGQFSHSVKWSTGSREYPNDFTLYV